MGTRIGEMAYLNVGRPDSFDRPRAAQGRAAPEKAPLDRTGRGEDEVRIEAGFGDGTLSPQAAALHTLGTNLRRARQIVPSVEEVREEFRARRAEQEGERVQREEERQAELREMTRFRPEPSPQVRNFVQEAERAPASEPAPAPPVANPADPQEPVVRTRMDVLV